MFGKISTHYNSIFKYTYDCGELYTHYSKPRMVLGNVYNECYTTITNRRNVYCCRSCFKELFLAIPRPSVVEVIFHSEDVNDPQSPSSKSQLKGLSCTFCRAENVHASTILGSPAEKQERFTREIKSEILKTE